MTRTEMSDSGSAEKGIVRPVVVVSRCLTGAPCRWDGDILEDQLVRQLGEQLELVGFCPEVSIGMGVPRLPIRLVREQSGDDIQVIQPTSGRNFTFELHDGSRSFLEGIDHPDGFLMKYKSPSCGIRDVKVYARPESETPVGMDQGIFARTVGELFPGWPMIDEMMLKTTAAREKWLRDVKTFAGFRQASASGEPGQLALFHKTYSRWLKENRPRQYPHMQRLLDQADEDPDMLFVSYRAFFYQQND